jgi:hypothetical protein
MKKILLIALFASTFMACNKEKAAETKSDATATSTTTATTATTTAVDEKPSGTKYRCDGFRPGMASEWVQVKYNSDFTKIEAIYYWNVNNEKPVKLTIHSQEFSKGEISGVTGDVSFPGDSEKVGLGIIEDRLNLIYADKRMQEFEMEQ